MNLFNAHPVADGITPAQIQTGREYQMQFGVDHEHANSFVFYDPVPCTNAIKSCRIVVILHPAPSTSTATSRSFSSIPPSFFRLTSSCMMKLQMTTVACLVVLLVVSEMVVTSEAAGCSIYQMVPCMAASKNAGVAPSKQCCTNIANMGKGLPGAKCLCSLLNHRLAKSNGVVPRIALGIPQKCRIAVPKGFVCQGIRVPGS